MRLIDADELKKCYETINGYNGPATYESIRVTIDNQPTAYDTDEVVKQINDEIRVIKNNICVEQSETSRNKLVHRLQQTEKILKIVKEV